MRVCEAKKWNLKSTAGPCVVDIHTRSEQPEMDMAGRERFKMTALDMFYECMCHFPFRKQS